MCDSNQTNLQLLVIYRAHLRGVDSLLLNLGAHQINRVLRDHDKILLDLVHLHDRAGKLIVVWRLDQQLLLRLGVLTDNRLTAGAVNIVIQLDWLVLLDRHACSMRQRGRVRENFLRARGLSSRSRRGGGHLM